MAPPVVFIITGNKAEGKSSLASSLATIIESRNFSVGGLVARGRWKQGRRSGFDLVVFGSDNPVPLADAISPCEPAPDRFGYPYRSRKGPTVGRDNTNSGAEALTAGRFIFNPAALEIGNSAIEDAMKEERDLIIVDEVGAAEIEGRLWAGALRRLLGAYRGVLLLITARKNLTAVLTHFRIDPAGIFCTGTTTPEGAAAVISGHINKCTENGKG